MAKGFIGSLLKLRNHLVILCFCLQKFLYYDLFWLNLFYSSKVFDGRTHVHLFFISLNSFVNMCWFPVTVIHMPCRKCWPSNLHSVFFIIDLFCVDFLQEADGVILSCGNLGIDLPHEKFSSVSWNVFLLTIGSPWLLH